MCLKRRQNPFALGEASGCDCLAISATKTNLAARHEFRVPTSSATRAVESFPPLIGLEYSMRRRRPAPPAKSPPALAKEDLFARPPIWLGGLLAALWWLAAAGMSTRIHTVMGYQTLRLLPAVYEPLAVSLPAAIFCGGLAAAWLILYLAARTVGSVTHPKDIRRAAGSLGLASVPLWISIAEVLMGISVSRHYWEALWLSGWTGMSFYCLCSGKSVVPWNARRQFCLVCLLATIVGVGWYFATWSLHESFMLGFNDFGHFGQRVASTAAGRGWLLETPVLPAFWDHFNPGLLLLVPLWSVWPDEQLFFVVQAAALAGSGLGLWAIAKHLGLGGHAPMLFAAAWLAQPSLGQMNLAYTYGWHPISIAIPFLLLAMWATGTRRFVLAGLSCLLAMSMEEGVILMVSFWSLAAAGRLALRRRLADVTDQSVLGLGMRSWLVIGLLSGLSFVLVYRWSGLAEFQTGRFVALGNSLPEVIASPVLRARAFWGQLLRPTSFYFVASLLLPCFVLSLARSWTILAAAGVPLGVLLVWHHAPATCLAFQYPSLLLGVFWFTAIEGTRRLDPTRHTAAACGALVTSLVLSLFVGQLPYSGQSMVDVTSATYAPDATWQRGRYDEDAIWMRSQIENIFSPDRAFLATGRIAAHLVGGREVETVGQFFLRQAELSQLEDRQGQPLSAYDWIILDRTEGFQQSLAETQKLEELALEAGFQVVEDRYAVVFLKRP